MLKTLIASLPRTLLLAALCASALPAPALELMLQQLGAARPFAAVVAGDGSLDDAISAAHAAVGRDAPVVASADALRAALAG